jgi:hypothetical protein
VGLGSVVSDIIQHMTKRLEQAMVKVEVLPEAAQDAIAEIVLAEIKSEPKWEAVIANSPEKFGKLADRAWRQHKAGKSQELDSDNL